VRGGIQHFSSGHSGHVVRHAIRKHQPPLLDDDVKLVDQPSVRVRSAHECTGLFIRTEDNKGLVPIPQTIRPSIRGSHPKTQKAPACLPTSDNLLLDGSLLQRQLHHSFEMPQQEPDVFERRNGLSQFMNGIEPEQLCSPGIDKQAR
jgi:hypothetical protein